ncbi:MAG: metal dependent phosphohydrolase [Gemmatimonadetes bacterium]|nr:metal dependent phosphohydrolase [Gemmatimonadota bacterium]
MSGRDTITVGEAAELAGNYLDALGAYQAALADPDPLVVADAHFHLGRVNWRQGRYDDAIREYESARLLAMRKEATELRARVENGLGVVHHARGEYAQARASYAVALEITADEIQRGRILLNLGAVSNIEGDFGGARSYYTKSRAIFERTGFVRGEASALHNLGMLNADEGRLVEADESYRRCLELLESLGDRPGIATVLLNRSELSCARGDFDDAIANCDLALSIYADVGDDVGRGEAQRWKGHALFRQKRFADAERVLADALKIARRSQVRLLEAESSWDMGLSRAAHGDGAGAKESLQRAHELFEQLGARRELAKVAAALAALQTE